MADRYSQGMKIRRYVLGDAYVDKAEKNKTDFDQPSQELITEAAWGHVLSRPKITPRERSMIAIALLAALGHDEEVATPARAAVNTGPTIDDITQGRLMF